MSYRNLFITTAQIPRESVFSLPYGLEVRCNRVAGWQLIDMNQIQYVGGQRPVQGMVIAGEYEEPGKWLVLDVSGNVIVDSRETGHEAAP